MSAVTAEKSATAKKSVEAAKKVAKKAEEVSAPILKKAPGEGKDTYTVELLPMLG